MNTPEIIILIIIGLMAGAFVLSFVRFALGPSRADRVIALDTLTIIAIGAALAAAAWTGSTAFVDVGLLLALLSFVSTVAFAFYQEKRNQP